MGDLRKAIASGRLSEKVADALSSESEARPPGSPTSPRRLD
jgi:hypothetical protein